MNKTVDSAMHELLKLARGTEGHEASVTDEELKVILIKEALLGRFLAERAMWPQDRKEPAVRGKASERDTLRIIEGNYDVQKLRAKNYDEEYEAPTENERSRDLFVNDFPNCEMRVRRAFGLLALDAKLDKPDLALIKLVETYDGNPSSIDRQYLEMVLSQN